MIYFPGRTIVPRVTFSQTMPIFNTEGLVIEQRQLDVDNPELARPPWHSSFSAVLTQRLLDVLSAAHYQLYIAIAPQILQ